LRFWDTSAIVPLLHAEAATPAVLGEYGRDPEMVVWWASDVECVSAIAREERSGSLEPAVVADALLRLDALAAAWQEVEPSVVVRRVAARLLRVHPLRASDALQLAAAILASENEPMSMTFVTLDDRLAMAARREGFVVIGAAV
jgi:predicted nucleic acid-binding protein